MFIYVMLMFSETCNFFFINYKWVNNMSAEVKCVVWDLDNTIWNGTLLEDGPQGIKLKDGIKTILKTLDKRGILNSIASKNNCEEALNRLKEFKIEHYFLYPQINWNPKSSSIKKIQESLNIGMDTIMFIDDQDFELDEVGFTHEDIICLNASEYKTILERPRLNPRFKTEDSRRRRKMYLDAMERQEEEDSFKGPKEEFLKSLDMKLIISEANEKDLERAEELTIRTNQLNATGITYNYNQLKKFINSSKYLLLVCELTDKYGSYGKIGLVLIEKSEEKWHIRLLLFSCRVMSRGIGTLLLTYIMQRAKETSKKLFADFRKTDRNKMMYITYKFANFKEVSSGDSGYILFENDLSIIQEIPPYIKLEIK